VGDRQRVAVWRRIMRGAIHTPHGWLSSRLLETRPAAGAAWTVGFFFYEAVEDIRIEDHAYVDLIGWLIGFSARETANMLKGHKKGGNNHE